MAKVMLATGLIVAYGYFMEIFMALYSGNVYEQCLMLKNRLHRPVRAGVLGADPVQRRHPAVPVVQVRCGGNAVDAVRHRDRREHRHVARAVRHHRDEPAPRLPAQLVGHVLPDDLGLGAVRRLDRAVLLPAVPVHPVPAGDLGLRDARAGVASSEGPRRRRRAATATRAATLASEPSTGGGDA